MELSPLAARLLGQPPPVSPKEFHDRLWVLNAVGDEEEAYIKVGLVLKHKRKTFSGETVTFDMIVEKYTAYLKHCKAVQTPPKFVRRIGSFAEKGGYNTEYKTHNPALRKRFGL